MIPRFIIALTLVLISAPLTRAQLPPLPGVDDGWTVEKSIIDVKISDSAVAYLGFELTYQNPNDPYEFIMVVMRSIPSVIVKSNTTDSRSLRQASIANYTKKDEQDTLRVMFQERSDPIIYIKWRVKNDANHEGIMVQDGEAMVWFQNYTGEWIVDDTGKKISVEFITELITNGKDKNISVGRKYSLDDVFQMMKVDRSYLEAILGKGEKK